MKALRLRISGDVQGVSYRFYARAEANKLGLAGFAKNEHDGSVDVLVQGEETKLTEFIGWARGGSPMATVGNVEIKDAELVENLIGFEVK